MLYREGDCGSVRSNTTKNRSRIATFTSIGEISRELEKSASGPGRGNKSSPTAGKPFKKQTLATAGLTKSVAHRCEKIANIPEEKFEEVIEKAKAEKKPITYADVEKAVKQKDKTESLRQAKQARCIQSSSEVKNNPPLIRNQHYIAEKKDKGEPISSRELIKDELKANPSHSDRWIAKGLGVHQTTVGTIRKELEQSGEVSNLDTSIGSDGRVYPRKRNHRADVFGMLYRTGNCRGCWITPKENRRENRTLRRNGNDFQNGAKCQFHRRF